MFEKIKNKENLGKIWKRATDIAKVISGEVSDSCKSIQQKVKEKSEDWEELEVKTDEVKTDEVKTDEVKTDEVKTDEVKTDEVKTDEVKTDKVKTDEVKDSKS
jgi:hypothetical protein